MTDAATQDTHTPAAADARFAAAAGSQAAVPPGSYCYVVTGPPTTRDGQTHLPTGICPFWALDRSRQGQDNGYCALLRQGDWQDGSSGLLWDQVKACSLNTREVEL